MKLKKVYLAIPYKGNEEESFRIANRITSKLMKEGYIVYSPISHNHPIAVQEGLPRNWEFWEQYDKIFVAWCDVLYVCKMDGWKESTGVKAEMKIAENLGKSITFIDYKY